MTKANMPLPAQEDLPELYRILKAKLERLEGAVRQVLAERTSEILIRPTWSDIEDLKEQIASLQRRLPPVKQDRL